MGEQGFRYLIDLNDDLSFRLPERSEYTLLGKYAESLLAFWLAHAPHCRLLANHLAVFNDENQSVGEMDFIAEINGVVYHLELTCKYYGAADGQPENMVGLNEKDTMFNKINKLNQQLAYSQNHWGRAALVQMGVNPDAVRRATVVRGVGFSVSGSLPHLPLYPVNAWTGQFILNYQDIVSNGEKWFYRLPKTAFLSPARISGSLKCESANLGDEAGLIAEVVQRPDGYFHEIQRYMLKK